jgi:hypothetical protein
MVTRSLARMNHTLRSALSRQMLRVGVVVLLAVISTPAVGLSAQGRHTAGTDPASAATTPAAWSGRYDLFRKGVFSSQQKITWCVAASVQMMLNIIEGTKDHSRAGQERYIRYARTHDQFQDPKITGTDGQGWVAALNHFGGLTNYHIVASKSYTGAIRSAVRRLRATGEPVGLVIDHHNHAWVMTGFESSSDPAADPGFTLKAVYIMGPLYPRAPHNGMDPAPDKRITYRRLKTFLTRYIDAAVAPNNPWEGTYVTIQP